MNARLCQADLPERRVEGWERSLVDPRNEDVLIDGQAYGAVTEAGDCLCQRAELLARDVAEKKTQVDR